MNEIVNYLDLHIIKNPWKGFEVVKFFLSIFIAPSYPRGACLYAVLSKWVSKEREAATARSSTTCVAVADADNVVVVAATTARRRRRVT